MANQVRLLPLLRATGQAKGGVGVEWGGWLVGNHKRDATANDTPASSPWPGHISAAYPLIKVCVDPGEKLQHRLVDHVARQVGAPRKVR